MGELEKLKMKKGVHISSECAWQCNAIETLISLRGVYDGSIERIQRMINVLGDDLVSHLEEHCEPAIRKFVVNVVSCEKHEVESSDIEKAKEEAERLFKKDNTLAIRISEANEKDKEDSKED